MRHPVGYFDHLIPVSNLRSCERLYEAAYPCVVLSPPTEGDCTVLIAWHIDKGEYGSVSLDGLNVAFALHSPGHMAEVKWNVAVYLDDKAQATQKEALTSIFSGQAGGHPSVLAAHVGNNQGITDAPMEYEAIGKQRSLHGHAP